MKHLDLFSGIGESERSDISGLLVANFTGMHHP